MLLFITPEFHIILSAVSLFALSYTFIEYTLKTEILSNRQVKEKALNRQVK